MNYLAHFHLSYGDHDLLLGALLGDYVKGPLDGRYRRSLEQGIVLHRKIDAFADSHAGVRALQRQFDAEYRRYGGIMTDIVFDHFLTLHWQRFHPQPLEAFSREIYRVLDHQALPVSAAQAQAQRLIRYDVLTGFGNWQTVEAALDRVRERLGRDNPLAGAADHLQHHYRDLEHQFLAFYPQLMAFSEGIRRDFSKVTGLAR